MIGQTIAHYTITAKIGAGGMGEVFRARDEKLNRDVALKILPEHYTQDAQRMGRFQREAQLLASLNHPNIAAIYGLEEAGATRALVLELVEGEDLSELLQSRTPGVDETLEIAVQIAEALESAHEKGIIHRDLKPANVKITAEGKVKVLDFGLAKALVGDPAGDPSEVSLSMSPTMTAAATSAGLILGTAAYMSPEQARGKVVDRRADIWAFGVLLYELLTRKQLFAGETVSDTLAAVIKDEPDWSLIPGDAPPLLAELIRRCLEKDPRRRLQSIGEARIALEDVLRPGERGASMLASSFGVRALPDEEPVVPAGPGIRSRLGWISALVLVAAGSVWLGMELAPGAPGARARKFHLDAEELNVAYPTQPVLSPDGTHVAYFAGANLWIRDLEALEPVKLPDTELATAPFWSPDGNWLAFGETGRIFKVPAAGGQPVAICDVNFGQLDGGCWSDDDVLYLAPNSGPIHRVSARGGDPRAVFELGTGDSDYHTPSALPGGRGIIFTTHNEKGRETVECFADGERKVLFEIPGARLEFATWVRGSGNDGYLVYHRQQTNSGIWAAPFNIEALEITGEPFVLDPDGAFPSVGRDGSLLYAVGSGGGERQLARVSRSGEILESLSQPQTGMIWPELSPDGRYVLLSAQDADNRDVWLHDIERGTRTRMTFGSESDYYATWANQGRDIVFTNGSAQTNVSYRRPADGSREPEAFLNGYYPHLPDGVGYVIYNRFVPGGGDDLFYRALDAEAEEMTFLTTPAVESGPRLSPDGRFVIYMSNESGSNQIYLTTFPEAEGKWQVSTDGGAWPRWSRSGDEILYRQSSGAGGSLMAVSLQTEPSVHLGTPERLFGAAEAPQLVFGSGYVSFTPTEDPDIFIMLQYSGDQPDHVARLVYLENWMESYRRSVN